jgi:hypothetical protein
MPLAFSIILGLEQFVLKNQRVKISFAMNKKIFVQEEFDFTQGMATDRSGLQASSRPKTDEVSFFASILHWP